MTFYYEQAELNSLSSGPFKIKLHDGHGNHTKWLTLDNETYGILRNALIAQGVRNADARKGLE